MSHTIRFRARANNEREYAGQHDGRAKANHDNLPIFQPVVAVRKRHGSVRVWNMDLFCHFFLGFYTDEDLNRHAKRAC
jgi:hypothetical protein